MMCFKTEDEILQMKHFVKTYYMPILSERDIAKIDEEYDYIETMKEVDVVVTKRDLSSPRKPSCSRHQKNSRLSENDFPSLNRYQLANMTNDERGEYLKKRFRAFDLSAKSLRKDCKEVEGNIRKLKIMTLVKNPLKIRRR